MTRYLIPLLILLSACNTGKVSQAERLVIGEGKHRSKPYKFRYNKDTLVVYEWVAGESWTYDHRNINQCDWNKLSGWSFHLWGNHRNSVMIAWRYDLAGYMLFSPYYHENGKTWWAGASCTRGFTWRAVDRKLPVLRVGLEDIIETRLYLNRDKQYTSITISNLSTGDKVTWRHTWSKKLGRVREIYPWFGGDEEAAQRILIYRRLRYRG